MEIPPTLQPELAQALFTIHKVLNNQELIHVQEQDVGNSDFWICGACDEDNYINIGFVGWNKETNRIDYIIYDPVSDNHNESEGVPEENSKCFWVCPTIELFVSHLIGDLRVVNRELMAEKLLDKLS